MLALLTNQCHSPSWKNFTQQINGPKMNEWPSFLAVDRGCVVVRLLAEPTGWMRKMHNAARLNNCTWPASLKEGYCIQIHPTPVQSGEHYIYVVHMLYSFAMEVFNGTVFRKPFLHCSSSSSSSFQSHRCVLHINGFGIGKCLDGHTENMANKRVSEWARKKQRQQ